ncbi:hypothetical protein BV25DRAFT_1824920 [Artomyces pyxidatus]|uniref:Uncharacterized protein n=1 Tax=Artomyces pyxidatus TaxID=48021 RepID=A0ACB8T312_9AGAM|nr:hypothetical protein BV25DRAFT_1824920 [Artomyces pyxidatus]
MKAADESELSTRKIKALPRRLARIPDSAPGATSTPSPDASPAPAAPKMGGFTGFGSASTNSSFTFTPSSSTNSITPAADTPSLGAFSAAPSTSTRSPFLPPSSAPSVSASASNATKQFASFLSPKLSAAPAPSSAPEVDKDTLKYYTSLRGLNNSFVTAISKAVESDPFVDIAEVLEQYKKHRVSVQQEFDEKASRPQFANSATPIPSAKPPAPSPFAFGKPTPSSPIPASMPAPPSSFAGFPPAPSFAPSSAQSGGFTPQFGEAGGMGKSSGSVFGSSTSIDSKPVQPQTTPSLGSSLHPFQLSTANSTAPPKSAFGLTPPVEPPSDLKPKDSFSSSNDSTSKPTSTFGSFSFPGSSPFGSSSTAASSLFGRGSTPKSDIEQSADKPKAPFTFGIPPSTKLFGDGSAFGASTPSPDKPVTEFGSPGKTSPFNFGSSSTSPVSFGFGVSPKTSGDTSPTPKAGNIGFSFGASPPKFDAAPAPSTSDGTSRAETPATEGSQDEDGLSRFLSPGVSGTEGEGEEDEETTYTVKAKVYKLVKDKEGKSDWSDIGVGMLRFKKHKDTGARRILLRNSSTGKIILNFNLYAGLKSTLGKKMVSLIGHGESGESIPYRIRVGTEESAITVKEVLDRELSLVESESAKH